MKLTGLYFFDDALDRHPLFSVPHRSPLQSCAEITVAMTSQQVARELAVKDLQNPPFCLKQAIKQYRLDKDISAPCLRLHRVTMPNGQPLCWTLMTSEGEVLEEVFCVHKAKYPDYCRAIIRYIVQLTKQKITIRRVA